VAYVHLLAGIAQIMAVMMLGDLKFKRRRMDDYDYAAALRFVAQMAEGLGALHSRRVFYGDLALRNVLMGYDDKVLLADFGVSLDDHPRGIKAQDMYKFGSMSSPPEADDPDALLTIR
jgi:serine/threonine protein kinase